MSNPTYGQGSDPTASGGSSAGAPEPYASDQPVSADPYTSDQPISADSYTSDQAISTDPYTDLPSQSTDVSYGTVGQSTGYDDSTSTRDVAKGEAGAVKDTAVGAGRNVASTARDEAANVVAEAGTQAKSLMGTVTEEVRSQGRTQQSRLAGAVHSVAQELGSMSAKSEQSGPVADLAQQASRKAGEVGHWLENKEPAEVLDDIRAFARRRPAMFLGLCALAGVVVGRLGREPSRPIRALTRRTAPRPTATTLPRTQALRGGTPQRLRTRVTEPGMTPVTPAPAAIAAKRRPRARPSAMPRAACPIAAEPTPVTRISSRPTVDRVI